MTDLLEEAKPVMSISAELETTLRRIDELQRICSVEDFCITKPTKDDVPKFLKAIDDIAAIARTELEAGT